MADSTTVEYIAKLVDNVSAPLKRIESNAEQARKGIEGVGSVFGALAKFELTSMGFDAIQSSISKTIDLTKEYEDNLTRLEVILGDPKLAKSYTDQMQTIADSTNYTFAQLSGTYTKLAGSIDGLAPEQLKGGVLDFANATKGAGSLDSLAEAIKDISNSERWKEFGIKSEKIGDNVALTFKKVRKVVAGDEASIFKAIQEFGQMKGIQGMTERMGETLSGRLSTLEDTWDGLFRRIGVANSKAFGNIAGALTSLLKSDAISNFVGAIASGISNTISFFQNLDFSKTLESIKPITDLLVGAGGLLTLIWQNMGRILEPFSKQISPIMQGLKDVLSYIGNALKSVFGGFDAWKTRLEGLINYFQKIYIIISYIFEKVFVGLIPILKIVVGIIGVVAKTITTAFDYTLMIVNKVLSVTIQVSEFFGWVYDNILSKIGEKISGLFSIFQPMVDSLALGFGEIGKSLSEIGVKIKGTIETIINAIGNGFTWVIERFIGLANKLSLALGGKEFKSDFKEFKFEFPKEVITPKLPEATAEALAKEKGKENKAIEQKAKTSVTGETINTAKPQRIIVNIGSLINGYNQTINLKQATVEEGKNLASLVQSEVVKLLVSAVNDVASLE